MTKINPKQREGKKAINNLICIFQNKKTQKELYDQRQKEILEEIFEK